MGTKRRIPITAILACTLLILLALGVGTWIVTARVWISGSAELSGGRQIKVVANSGVLDSGLSISSSEERTTIESGNYVVEFHGNEILVNGQRIGSLPEVGNDYELFIDRLTGVKVKADGEVIAAMEK